MVNHKWVILGSLLFIGLNFLFILKDQWLFAFLPFALILVFIAIIRMDWALLFCAFSAPLSFNLEYLTDGKLGLFMPTEPLLAGLMILVITREIHKPFLPKELYRHPVFFASVFYLFWLFVTAITSTHPVVSFKFLLVRLWFFIPVLYFGVFVFRNELHIKRFIWLFTVGMSIVVTYTLIHHYQYNFAEKEGHWVMWPFFKDHTGYGAMIAFIIPLLLSIYRSKAHSLLVQVTLFGLITLAFIGVYFSYTRAAWLSLIAAFLVWTVMKLRIRFKYLAFVGILGGIIVLTQWDKINMELARNKSEHTTEDFGTRLQSTTNVTSDASNLERINRWTAAIEMFKSRPWFGFGPGTYAFEYAPYQHSQNLTIISTNFGDLGNAHSEYLGPLAETGWIGALSFLLLVTVVFYTGITLYIRYPDGEMKTLLMGMILALVTYFVHGLLNNYLDTDKAAVPVWGILAAFVALDIQLKKNSSPK